MLCVMAIHYKMLKTIFKTNVIDAFLFIYRIMSKVYYNV